MELMRDLEGQTHRRAASLDGAAISSEERTMEFSFSSEYPVQRYFGNEVLSHERGAVDLGRLSDGAPVLFNHDPLRVIGVVQRAWIDNEKMRGMVSVKFSRNAFAQEVLTDVADGVLRNVSVGYSINQMEERGDNFVATSWQPYEVSVVGIPADPTIGIGRKLDTDGAAPAATPTPSPSPIPMEDTNLNLEAVRAEAAAQAANAERTRIASINALTERHGLKDLGATLIENGRSIDEAREAVLDKINARAVETVKPVEMDQRDASRFNITAGIRAALSGDWSSYEAGLVREMSAEVAKSMGRAPSAERAFFIPFSALTRATYVTSGASTGGNLVATELMDQDFIEFLRNRSVMLAAGVRTMPGLQGNVAIPRRSGVASTYYLSSQTTAITQSESTFDQVTLSPKNLAALSKYSRQTLLQATPGIEQLVRTDLIDGINVAMDLGILNGSGSSGQPTGIMQTSGIGSVAIGTNGGAITLETLVNLETELTIDNVPVDRNTVSYITNAKVMGNLKKLRAGGSSSSDGPFLVNDNLLAIGRGATPSVVNGYPIYVTNQVPSTLTKGSTSGTCSAVLIGDYSQAMVGLWGNGLEITVGEDSDDFSKALTSVRGIVTYDVAVRDAKAFAACLDVTTS
jgi:HK97 family phage major capsid protein/HK97 family phage prohead protease